MMEIKGVGGIPDFDRIKEKVSELKKEVSEELVMKDSVTLSSTKKAHSGAYSSRTSGYSGKPSKPSGYSSKPSSGGYGKRANGSGFSPKLTGYSR